MKGLEITNVTVTAAEKTILHDLSLSAAPGTMTALMGQNGSGKSTLAQTIIGNPDYTVTAGAIHWQGHDITQLPPEQRARLGIFLAWQQPVTLPGVSLKTLLGVSLTIVHGTTGRQLLTERLPHALELLKLPSDFAEVTLDGQLSGGEKKKVEAVQLLVLQPPLAILDEADSGLDIDAVSTLATAMQWLQKSVGTQLLIISHYHRLLQQLQPDQVVVLAGGSVVKTGGAELADQIEQAGYEAIT